MINNVLKNFLQLMIHVPWESGTEFAGYARVYVFVFL